MEVPIEHAASVLNLSYDVMNNYPLERFKFLELPIGCEGDVGISWGETEVVHEGVTQAEVLEVLARIRSESLLEFGF